jgi:hypothetical protein
LKKENTINKCGRKCIGEIDKKEKDKNENNQGKDNPKPFQKNKSFHSII